MRIIHRVSKNSSTELIADLASMGIEADDNSISILFEITEDDQRWPEVAAWIKRRDAFDLVRTEFSKSEIEAASWVSLRATWLYGYPQPDEMNAGYLEATYDLSDYCEECGMGVRQKAPFQIKGEPKWGRRGIFQLNWVFDEFFVTPQVWETVFAPFGVGRGEVRNKKGETLQTVVQLVVDETVSMSTDGLEDSSCPRCGRTRHLPVTRGPLPPLTETPSAAIVKTREYFGSGGSAFHEILLRADLAKTFRDAKIRGASLYLVADL